MTYMRPEHEELRNKILDGVKESMDKLILERMDMNHPLIVERNGKIQKISPFIIAEERWGKAFVEQWRKEQGRSGD